MTTRQIGSLSASLVGLGCNNFGKRLDQARTNLVVAAALDAGINFFDTADVYGETRSEEQLGRALGARRKDVLIASKFGIKLDEARPGGAHPDYVRRAVEDSLRRLGTDYIDLYQLHRPDSSVPIADTLGALDGLVKAGKVREIGASNFDVAQVREAEAAVEPGAARFVSVQNEYSLLVRAPEQGLLSALRTREIGFLPYFPLASGLLSGKYERGKPAPAGARLASWPGLGERFLSEANVQRAEALKKLAEARGRTLLELAFSWLAANPAVSSIIAGATTPEQVRANAAAVNWKLDADTLGEIDRITRSPADA